jgi:hypothetical protein
VREYVLVRRGDTSAVDKLALLLADQVNAAVFPSAKDLLASGYLWEENRNQLAWKPLVVVQRDGRGSVIGFTADSNFRAYLDGPNVLFLNAVFRGPAYRGGSTPSE